MNTFLTFPLLAFALSAAAVASEAQQEHDVCKIEIEPTVRNKAVHEVVLENGGGYIAFGARLNITNATMVDCPPDVFCYMLGSTEESRLVAFSNESPLLQPLTDVHSVECLTCARSESYDENVAVVQYSTEAGTWTNRVRWSSEQILFSAPVDVIKAVIKSGPEEIRCIFSYDLKFKDFRQYSKVFSKREPLNVPFNRAEALTCWIPRVNNFFQWR